VTDTTIVLSGLSDETLPVNILAIICSPLRAVRLKR